jgi:aminopeptidase N
LQIFERLGEKHEYTKLIQDHRGIDPDDAYTSIPYEKGSAFLLHIEQHLQLPLPGERSSFCLLF